jgi:hypothetical protein
MMSRSEQYRSKASEKQLLVPQGETLAHHSTPLRNSIRQSASDDYYHI